MKGASRQGLLVARRLCVRSDLRENERWAYSVPMCSSNFLGRPLALCVAFTSAFSVSCGDDQGATAGDGMTASATGATSVGATGVTSSATTAEGSSSSGGASSTSGEGTAGTSTTDDSGTTVATGEGTGEGSTTASTGEATTSTGGDTGTSTGEPPLVEDCVLIVDDLSSGSSDAAVIDGGEFIEGGWTPNINKNHLRYDLPKPVVDGGAQLWISNFDPPAQSTSGKHHVFAGRSTSNEGEGGDWWRWRSGCSSIRGRIFRERGATQREAQGCPRSSGGGQGH